MTWKLNPHGLILPADFAEAAAPRPVRDEVASTLDGRDITRGMVDPMRLELPDDTVLMQRGGGDYLLYQEILRDDRVKSGLDQRFRAVISRAIEVKAGGDSRLDKKAAADLEQQIQKLSWDAITEKMLYGVFYGFSVSEIMLGVDGARVTLDKIKVRNRRRFGFDGAGRLRMKTMAKPDGELMPDRKFWSYSCGADHDDAPYGLGLAHWLYWPVWLKRNGIRFWAVFLEKFGTPTGLGWFPPGTSPADQTKLLYALKAIQRDSAIILPEGMRAELLEAKRSGTADHESFTRLMNDAITILITGQTASTQGTPGKLGSDDEQGDVRTDITKADADLICMSFNATVARWMTDWNFPGAAYPQLWRKMDEEEDQNQAAERDERLSKVGFKPTLERVIEVYGEGYEASEPPPPDPAKQTLTPGGVSPKPVGQVEFAEPDASRDALDDLVDASLAEWESDITPLIAPIQAALAASIAANETAAQFMQRLPELFGEMDADPLTQRLARLAFTARLAGEAGIEP